MNKIDKLAAVLKDAGEAKEKKKTEPYDTTAKVVKVEGSTAWVNIPGGVDKTPATMVVNARTGEEVRVHVAGGKAYVTGNATSPPTDDSLAQKAENNAIRAQNAADTASAQAKIAKTSADSAVKDAKTAKTAADSAVSDATRAYNAAESAQASATAANTAAQEAKADAATANTAATNALRELSTVENVVDTLDWITGHGTMTLTTDVAVDPTHVYFVVDPTGQYVVGGTHYSIVEDPKTEELNTYYELTIDDAVTNYVATHLVVDTEGLWIVPATNNANRVLIAHGNGSTYTTAGTYIVGTGGAIIGKFTIGDVTVGDTSSDHATLTSSGLDVYHDNENVASFGDVMRIGQDGSYNISVLPNGVDGTNVSGQNYFGFNFDDSTTISSPFKTNPKYGVVFSARTVTPEGLHRTAEEKISSSFSTGTVLTIESNTSLCMLVLNNITSFTVVSTSNMNVGAYSNEAEMVTDSPLTITVGTSKTLTFSAVVRTNTGIVVTFTETAEYNASTNTIAYSMDIVPTANISLVDQRSYVYTPYYTGTVNFLPSSIHVGTTDSGMGACTSLFGLALRAQYDYQTVVGKFNNNKSADLFEVGKGTGVNARSNAFEVDSSGNVNIPSGAKYKINGTALAASDVSALATADKYTRSATGGLDWTTTAEGDSKVIMKSALAFWNGSYDGTTSNIQRLNGTVYIGGTQLQDFVMEQGAKTQSGVTWIYRKWKSGKVEAWTSITWSSQTPSQWVTNLYYKDLNTVIPSGIFSAVPSHVTATTTGADNNLQWTVYSTRIYDNSGTYSVTIRFTRPNSTAGAIKASIFLYS